VAIWGTRGIGGYQILHHSYNGEQINLTDISMAHIDDLVERIG